MGTDMTAVIEYDIQRVPSAPFSMEENIYSVSGWNSVLNTGSKNYAFFGAVAGIRNKTGIPPLYPPRDIPDPVHRYVKDKEHELQRRNFPGWLYLREIRAALRHQNIPDDYVNIEITVLLDLMETLEKRFGVDHARMIFAFD